jgi:uncharacterized protein
MSLPVTAFVAAICALLLLFTAVDTVRQRMRLKLPFGDGDDQPLISASRSHGNLAEHAPIVLLLLAGLELTNAWHQGLMGIGALFLAGRVLHIWGLYTPTEPGKPPLPRSLGVISTWLTLLMLAGWTLWLLATRNL